VQYADAVRLLLVLLVACLACGGTQSPRPRATLGAIAGLARDTKTGEVIAMAEIRVAGRTTTSNVYGIYDVDDLPPGTYTVVARFADQPVTVRNVVVTAGMATYVDLPFKLGEFGPIDVDYGDPRQGEIQRFASKVPRIEGVVADASTRARVAGAVVTASRGPDDDSLQTVTDEHGRYRFDHVPTGTYAVSAYYSIGGRAQIEVRRSDITVGDGEGVLVPLWIELAAQ
jgi:hypothetical protein